MKFGQALYQRSVPKWAAYNVNYNEIKRLIKERTSVGIAVPVSIPQSSLSNRWATLEDELFDILKEQHDNIILFLRSKRGEIDRRVTFLEKQVKSAQNAAQKSYSNTSLPKRRFHRLLEESESIGQDIQNLTRFASAQRLAFRKILKKYRKWTGSTSLQLRLDSEVFAAGLLNIDYAEPLERLATQSKFIMDQVQNPLSGRRSSTTKQGHIESPRQQSSSTILSINAAEKKGPIALDAALATVPFGQSSGSATYWIHPDNIDEAQALLLRYVREVHKANNLSRESSGLSVTSGRSSSQPIHCASNNTHIVYFDNPQRYYRDMSSDRPSKVALTGRWCRDREAIITLLDLTSSSASSVIVDIKQKDIQKALDRQSNSPESDQKGSTSSKAVRRVREYLSENRDVKGLARLSTIRSRYTGTANSSQVGSWATFDINIVISPFASNDPSLTNDEAESGQAFPHAVLNIRWEFGHTPEVVHVFDNTHLAERVKDFTLDSAAIYMANIELDRPSWNSLLEKDIRKVPIPTNVSSRRSRQVAVGTSSGASSAGEPSDSVFSALQRSHSSATSVSLTASFDGSSSPSASKSKQVSPARKKKKARIDAQSPPLRATRYWNEFDDGDEDVNPQEEYVIYVDPNEKLPGTETVSKAFGAMYKSLGEATSRVTSMLSLKPQPSRRRKGESNERTGLLRTNSTSNTDEGEFSDSDTTPMETRGSRFGTFVSKPRSISVIPRSAHTTLYRPHQLLTPRQQALERTYLWSYSGLLILSYMMLFISGVLLNAGRKKAYIEVDIAAITGIATAEICAVLSILFLWMARSAQGILHRSIVNTALIGIVLIGIAEIVVLIRRPVTKR